MAKAKVSLLQVFKTIIWPRKGILLVGLVLIIISRLAGLVVPIAPKYLMDDVVPNKDFELLNLVVMAVAVGVLIQAITSYILTQILSVEAQRLISTLRSSVQKQVLKLPI